MDNVERDIIEILSTLPNECAYIDYKAAPYIKREYPELIRDVISMLNSEEAINQPKKIIFGVDNSRKRHGIHKCLMEDDANYQNLFDMINPRPHILTGTVDYENSKYGFFYIYANNNERIYEVANTVYGDKESKEMKYFAVYEGQAYTRRGSKKYILMNKDRELLNNLKTQPDYTLSIVRKGIPISSDSTSTTLLIAAIIGGWNEDYPDDITLIECIAGERYTSWIQKVYTLMTTTEDIITCVGKSWEIKSRNEIFKQSGKYLLDSQVDSLFDQFKILASRSKPQYDLPREQRCISGILHQVKYYSNSLVHHFTEFWTSANINNDFFSSCSKNKIYNSTEQIINFLFSNPNWKVIASFENEFQPLAEAIPDVFIETVQSNLHNKTSGLAQYLQESETGIFAKEYGAPLYRCLAMLARFRRYFSSACYALMLIAHFNKNSLSTLTSLLLPWHPQTTAPIDIRKGILKGLMQEDNELGWQLAISLLPGKTRITFPSETPIYLNNELIPESISTSDYWDVSLAYLDFIIFYTYKNTKHLLEIINYFEEFPEEGFKKIYNCLKSNNPNINDINDRYKIWDALLSFATRHRKHSDSTWALPEEVLKQIDLLIEAYDPIIQSVRARRLFKNEQFNLIANNDYKKIISILKKLRTDELKSIWANEHLDGILYLVREADRAVEVGISLNYANICLSDEELIKIIFLLTSDNSKNIEFSKGFVINYLIKNRKRLEIIYNSLNDNMVKGKLLALFPLTARNRKYLKLLDYEAQDIFWAEISPYRLKIKTVGDYDYFISELCKHSRSIDAIEFISMHLDDEVLPSCECIYKALNSIIENNEQITQNSIYGIIQVIKWYQNHESDEIKKCIIEWRYLNGIKDSYDGVEPITLNKKLSLEPDFFIEAISAAFKSHNGQKRNLNDDEAKIATQFGTLLYYWRRIPGLLDEELDVDIFTHWMTEVVTKSREIDRYEIAMETVGRTLFHCPKDANGLFIICSVASTLHNDIDGHLLSGYSAEAISSRGANFVDPTGAPEFALEQQYNDNADKIDALGFFRFANALRQIANFYRTDALNIINEHQARFITSKD